MIILTRDEIKGFLKVKEIKKYKVIKGNELIGSTEDSYVIIDLIESFEKIDLNNLIKFNLENTIVVCKTREQVNKLENKMKIKIS